jgi:hypothetical protein
MAKRSNASLLRLILLSCIGVLVIAMTVLLLYSDGYLKNGSNSGKNLKIEIVDTLPKLSDEIRKPPPSLVSVINKNPKKKVAYAITVTKDSNFIDGALVLGYSAKKVHDKLHGFESEYEADLVAFVTSSVITSRPMLEKNGWRVLERKLPVELEEIENKEYMQKMKDSGCCGADEFLKLWAYTLVEYHRVIHLDMDSIVFQNMDELYNIDKEMLFTGDWNMKAGSPAVPAQGGFLIVKPSIETFEEFKAIIRKGDHGSKGWGGTGIGNFWGGTTIQGIIPYFYYSIHPGASMEMDRCIYNFMADNPYRPNTLKCINGEATCQDCRVQDPELIKSAHFTICQKPWTCTIFDNPRNRIPCSAIHKKWFTLRDEYEKSLGISSNYRVLDTSHVVSLGMCKSPGDRGYIPVPMN